MRFSGEAHESCLSRTEEIAGFKFSSGASHANLVGCALAVSPALAYPITCTTELWLRGQCLLHFRADLTVSLGRVSSNCHVIAAKKDRVAREGVRCMDVFATR